MHRSYLFAPGHNDKLLGKVFTVGADAVMLDLEDAVPPDAKEAARRKIAAVLAGATGGGPEGQGGGKGTAFVRVNQPRTDECAADLDAVGALAAGIRVPKCESADDVAWVAERVPGVPLICAIETAVGVLAAQEIAAVPGVRHLSMGGVDLQTDLRTSGGNLQTLYVRSHLVVVSRAAGLDPPIDSVYPHLSDATGLRDQARFAHSLGFFGKSAIHPRQIPILHEVFTPTEADIAWARAVIDAFDAAEGAACRLPSGLFVDLPVAERARRVLQLHRGEEERAGAGQA